MTAKVDDRVGAAEEEPARWWQQRAGTLPVWAWIVVTLGVVALALGTGAWWTYGRGGPMPPVEGLYRGQEVSFVHTEASDPEVARTLTGMTGSPVLVVPGLSNLPEASLADVYVFANGVRGRGPLGFQPDVFDSAPGDPGYSPLRRVSLVTWVQGARPRVLRSAQEVTAAEGRGEVRVEATDAVVNMPFVSWPGGGR